MEGKLSGSKKEERNIVIYDLALLPNNMNVEDVMKYYNDTNIILYDSSKEKNYTHAPQIINIKV